MFCDNDSVDISFRDLQDKEANVEDQDIQVLWVTMVEMVRKDAKELLDHKQELAIEVQKDLLDLQDHQVVHP